MKRSGAIEEISRDLFLKVYLNCALLVQDLFLSAEITLMLVLQSCQKLSFIQQFQSFARDVA